VYSIRRQTDRQKCLSYLEHHAKRKLKNSEDHLRIVRRNSFYYWLTEPDVDSSGPRNNRSADFSNLSSTNQQPALQQNWIRNSRFSKNRYCPGDYLVYIRDKRFGGYDRQSRLIHYLISLKIIYHITKNRNTNYMKQDRDYIQDLTEIRTMMARSSKFLSLSGWAGIMAGIYALAGSAVAWFIFDFNPGHQLDESLTTGHSIHALDNIILLGLTVLILTFGTAVFLSNKKADKGGEKLWNAASKNMMMNLAVPLISGGILMISALLHGLTGLLLPLSLIFYGLALYSAGKFTFEEIRSLGLLEIALGLFSAVFIEYSLLCWVLGFGVLHIVYGIYMHYRYER
jgi:hypothetical protein